MLKYKPTVIYTVMCHLSADFGSQGFWLDKWNMWISEMPYYTWYHDGSHAKCADDETTGLLKRHDYIVLFPFS